VGFMTKSEPPLEVLTVATAMGKAQLLRPDDDGTMRQVEYWGKARLFVLEDRTAVLIVGAPGGGIERIVADILESAWVTGSRQLSVVVVDGDVLVLDGQGCGCGMGAIGNAGPVDGAYRLSRVRAPEWHTVT
jgi:hypothetical protein